MLLPGNSRQSDAITDKHMCHLLKCATVDLQCRDYVKLKSLPVAQFHCVYTHTQAVTIEFYY